MKKTTTINPLLPYENKWVALTPDNKNVLASAKDVKILVKKLNSLKVGKDKAIMTWVPSFDGRYAP